MNSTFKHTGQALFALIAVVSVQICTDWTLTTCASVHTPEVSLTTTETAHATTTLGVGGKGQFNMSTTRRRVTADEVIASYTPTVVSPDEWALLAPFVKEHVAAVVDETWTPDTTRGALRLVTRLASHVVSQGRSLTVGAVCTDSAINSFCYHHLNAGANHVQGSSRATLRRIAKAVNSNFDGPRERPEYGSDSKHPPYTEEDITGLRIWASAERNESRRKQARLLLALTLGAGLRSKEIANVTAGGVETDRIGTVIFPWGYRGAEKRFVPVEEEWAPTRRAAVVEAESDSAWLFRPLRSTADSGTVATFTKRSPHKGTVIDVNRARTTWIVNQCKKGVPESAVCEAAGLTDLQHYRRFLLDPENVSAREARAMLAGALREKPGERKLTVINGTG